LVFFFPPPSLLYRDAAHGRVNWKNGWSSAPFFSSPPPLLAPFFSPFRCKGAARAGHPSSFSSPSFFFPFPPFFLYTAYGNNASCASANLRFPPPLASPLFFLNPPGSTSNQLAIPLFPLTFFFFHSARLPSRKRNLARGETPSPPPPPLTSLFSLGETTGSTPCPTALNENRVPFSLSSFSWRSPPPQRQRGDRRHALALHLLSPPPSFNMAGLLLELLGAYVCFWFFSPSSFSFPFTSSPPPFFPPQGRLRRRLRKEGESHRKQSLFPSLFPPLLFFFFRTSLFPLFLFLVPRCFWRILGLKGRCGLRGVLSPSLFLPFHSFFFFFPFFPR